jgi:hypothetical protein
MKRCYGCKFNYPDREEFCMVCGHPLSTVPFWENYKRVILVSGAVLLLYVSMLLLVGPGRSRSSTPSPSSKQIPSMSQEERKEAQDIKRKACNTVDRLITAGGFTKVEPGYSGVTHAYVDRGFYQIPIDAKESALKWVAICHIDIDKKNQQGLVVIHDGYSGKEIGTSERLIWCPG